MLAVLEIRDALDICQAHFPEGPERLAEELGVAVECLPLQGCEGWCVQGDVAIICINSDSPPARRRFTLAHELAHLLLHTSTDVSFLGDLGCDGGDEEQSVNNLASQMLLPAGIVHEMAGDRRPLPKAKVREIATKANVSELVTMLRLVQLANGLGINDAFVADFHGIHAWFVPRGACPLQRARELAAQASPSGEFAYQLRDRSNLAMVFATDWSQTLFVQSVVREN